MRSAHRSKVVSAQWDTAHTQLCAQRRTHAQCLTHAQRRTHAQRSALRSGQRVVGYGTHAALRAAAHARTALGGQEWSARSEIRLTRARSVARTRTALGAEYNPGQCDWGAARGAGGETPAA